MHVEVEISKTYHTFENCLIFFQYRHSTWNTSVEFQGCICSFKLSPWSLVTLYHPSEVSSSNAAQKTPKAPGGRVLQRRHNGGLGGGSGPSIGQKGRLGAPCSVYGCFLKWWNPPNTPKWSFLVGKSMVVGYHHFRKPPLFVAQPGWFEKDVAKIGFLENPWSGQIIATENTSFGPQKM